MYRAAYVIPRSWSLREIFPSPLFVGGGGAAERKLKFGRLGRESVNVLTSNEFHGFSIH